VGEAVVARILLTHGHPDHAPGARPLSVRTGAAVLTHPFALRDGGILSGGGATLDVLHTPGHTSDHVGFLLREERALFSGDLIITGSTVVVAPPDGDMGAYLASLERLQRERLSRIYPGHGDVIDRPAEAIGEYIRHRRMREEQVLAALAQGPARISDLVSRIYAGVPVTLHGLAAQSVHAHLLKLRAEGRVAGTDAESPWRLA
jgi:glyoxylase-like metal-dependent hydrolase (beta-lactamase superfamily II)